MKTNTKPPYRLVADSIREKVLAAHRAGIRKVLLPADNEPDIEEIP